MFEIGDKVRVVDVGKCYSTYRNFAELHNLASYALECSPQEGATGTVIARGYRMKNGRC